MCPHTVLELSFSNDRVKFGRLYSLIEKEALALVWAYEKFEDYVLGKEIQLETDHKPLVPLLRKTHKDCLPLQILCFHLELMRFSYSICHVPGKEQYTADALSHAPLPTSRDSGAECIKRFVDIAMSTLSGSTDCLQEYRTAQPADTNYS